MMLCYSGQGFGVGGPRLGQGSPLEKEIQLQISSISSAPQSKNAVSIDIKHSRYIHLMSNLSSFHFHTKRLYVHVLDIGLVDTPLRMQILGVCC